MIKFIEKLRNLIQDVQNLPVNDNVELDRIKGKLEVFVRHIFDNESHYLKKINSISFYSLNVDTNVCWNEGKGKLTNLIEAVIEDIVLQGSTSLVSQKSKSTKKLVDSKKVFIVHGHDEEIKHAVARTVGILELEPIILHEQADGGRTVIEKFEENSSDVGFAIILFTPDDLAYPSDKSHESAKYRARQNVILELGYFTGKLSRKNVMVIFRKSQDFEIPSDFAGVIYTPYDSAGNWKFKLCKELKSAGFDVDSNKLL